MSSIAIAVVIVSSVGGVGWGSSMSICWGCGVGSCGGRALVHGGIISGSRNFIVFESV